MIQYHNFHSALPKKKKKKKKIKSQEKERRRPPQKTHHVIKSQRHNCRRSQEHWRGHLDRIGIALPDVDDALAGEGSLLEAQGVRLRGDAEELHALRIGGVDDGRMGCGRHGDGGMGCGRHDGWIVVGAGVEIGVKTGQESARSRRRRRV